MEEGILDMSNDDRTAYSIYTMFMLAALFVALQGCHKAVPIISDPVPVDIQGEVVTATISTSGTVTADVIMHLSDAEMAKIYPKIERHHLKSIAAQVFFNFDSFALSSDSVDSLAMTADYLKEEPGTVYVEGNCDDRGTVEYNKALGIYRADMVINVLQGLGVKNIIIGTSNGKDSPVCSEHTEECWQRNRRVDVIVGE
jgi:outer membrane protein OmpA-like peptidoglycan-associated protein